jgi:type IV secretion system protein VirB10
VPPGGPQNPQASAAEQARQRAAQERDSARTSHLFLGDGTAATAQPSAAVSPSVALSEPATTPTPPTGQAAKRAFLKTQSDGRFESASRLIAPSSANVVQAGSIIPAALITGIRSDLPGQITAQVTQNVYDSPTGRILLIPQGARLIGDYDPKYPSARTACFSLGIG